MIPDTPGKSGILWLAPNMVHHGCIRQVPRGKVGKVYSYSQKKNMTIIAVRELLAASF